MANTWEQSTYTASEVEKLKRSFPNDYAYETRECEVSAVQNAHFMVAPGVILGSPTRWRTIKARAIHMEKAGKMI